MYFANFVSFVLFYSCRLFLHKLRLSVKLFCKNNQYMHKSTQRFKVKKIIDGQTFDSYAMKTNLFVFSLFVCSSVATKIPVTYRSYQPRS